MAASRWRLRRRVMSYQTCDLAVIGAGPSALGFLAGLQPRTERRILVIAPGPDTAAPARDHRARKVPRSPKLRQPQVAAAVGHWLRTLPLREASAPSSFAAIGVHGIGGSARYWGGTLSVFPDHVLQANGLNVQELHAAYASLGSLVPVSGNVADRIAPEFRPLAMGAPVARSRRMQHLDGSYCGGRLVVGSARVAIRSSGGEACTGCNKCLSGCATDSIWAPREQDFRALGHEVDFCSALVERIEPQSKDSVTITCSRAGATLRFRARHVVLACGPIPAFVLLAGLVGDPEVRAPLVHSPTFGFALWGGFERRAPMFGMAQAALFARNAGGAIDSIGSLYDGASLTGYPERVFFDDWPRDAAAQAAARFLLFGAIYVNSSWSRCELRMSSDGLAISGAAAPGFVDKAAAVRRLVQSFGREAGAPLVSFQEGGRGVDVHYGDGVPESLRSPQTASRGALSGLPQVTIVGGACFQALPPHYPTLTFMAQALSVGRAFSADV